MPYENGLPFSDSLKKNIDKQIERIESDKASAIVIDGGYGEGKTTLCKHVGNYINKKFGLPKIDLKKESPQFAMGGKEFVSKIRTCFENKYPCLIYSEASDFSKRGALTRFNANLNMAFNIYRKFGCIVLIDLVSFDILDNNLMDNKIIRFTVHLKNRGKTYGDFEGFSLHRMYLLKYYMAKTKIKIYAYRKVRPNFRGHFLNLDKAEEKELDNASTKSKLEILKKTEIQLSGLMAYSDLAHSLSKSIRWVREAVSLLKIKPKRIIKRQKFFDEDAMNVIADYSDEIEIGRPKTR